MTRQEIERDYQIRNGVIVSPGKFEGEPIYAPYFWEIGMDGFADSDDGKTYRFRITDEDRKLFPEIPRRRRSLHLYEDSQGFVYVI